MPQHNHTVGGSSTAAATPVPGGNLLATGSASLYGTVSTPTTLHPGTISTAGISEPHNNMQPYLALNFCIALVGIFPPRN